MPQHGAEPPLPPPPCGARGDAFSTRAIRWVRNHHGHTGRKRVLESYALLLLLSRRFLRRPPRLDQTRRPQPRHQQALVAEEAPVAVALSTSRAPLPYSWWLSSVRVVVAAVAAVAVVRKKNDHC